MSVEAPARVAAPVVPVAIGAAVLAQVGYPLVSGPARNTLTIAIVLLVAAAALLHAGSTRGRTVCLTLAAVTVGGGFAVEVLGVHTGVPFGDYAYGSTLGVRLLGVPVVIAFAWTMLAWPAALAARRLCTSFAGRVALGAWGLAAWDLYLDPQMVAAGHWQWRGTSMHLPGVPTVPLSDYAGWLVVSALISWALQWVLRDSGTGVLRDSAKGMRRDSAEIDDRWPLAFYVWTWASSALALFAFLGLPAAALWGAVAMGTVAVPLVRKALR
jgi:putative membrane protein